MPFTDTTYPDSRVSIRQDGSLSIPSGSNVYLSGTVDMPGATVNSTASFTYTGIINASLLAGSVVGVPVETGTTTAAFANYGLTAFGTTATNAWTLAAPSKAGLYKTLACVTHGATTVSQTVTCVGATILNATTAPTSVMTFTSRASVSLVSVTTATWVLAHPAPTANVAFS